MFVDLKVYLVLLLADAERNLEATPAIIPSRTAPSIPGKGNPQAATAKEGIFTSRTDQRIAAEPCVYCNIGT